MRIRIDNITKGTFSLPTHIDTRDRRLRIAVKDIGCWVWFYNMYGEKNVSGEEMAERAQNLK